MTALFDNPFQPNGGRDINLYPTSNKAPKQTPEFSPYVNNGGTTLAVAGEDFCVIAGDTRMSNGYSIQSRNICKIIKLTEKCSLATSGMQADTLALHKRLKMQLAWFVQQHGKEMSTPAIAQFLGNTLYYKRFFPYYTFNVLAGVDEDGIGCCWSYDAVGSHERVKYTSSGTGQSLIQPLLDNQVAGKNQANVGNLVRSIDETVGLVKDMFTSAGERDIYTGDAVDIFVVTPKGTQILEKFQLKAD